MRSALISDIHGNLEALTSVLHHIETQKVGRIFCLGDVVGYGADPSACLALVAENCEIVLKGNHEAAVLGIQSTEHYNTAARTAADWTRHSLSDSDLDLMASFELEKHLEDCYLVHASPDDPDQWHYIFTVAEATRAFEQLNGNLGFHGHSHIPAILLECGSGKPRAQGGHTFTPDPESRYLVNIGSIGQPRDNDPRACYVVFDSDEYEIEFHRVEYDIKTAQQKMISASLPEVLASRLAAGV